MPHGSGRLFVIVLTPPIVLLRVDNISITQWSVNRAIIAGGGVGVIFLTSFDILSMFHEYRLKFVSHYLSTSTS